MQVCLFLAVQLHLILMYSAFFFLCVQSDSMMYAKIAAMQVVCNFVV